MALAQERNVLLENVDALMKKRWGKVIKTRLSEKAKVGQGTHDRIIEGASGMLGWKDFCTIYRIRLT